MPQVAMLTWAYFAALLTDPGEVPVGWHPFPDDAVGWRQRALWWQSTVLAAAVAAGQPVDVQWVQGFTLQFRGSVHAAAVQPPLPYALDNSTLLVPARTNQCNLSPSHRDRACCFWQLCFVQLRNCMCAAFNSRPPSLCPLLPVPICRQQPGSWNCFSLRITTLTGGTLGGRASANTASHGSRSGHTTAA